MTDEPEVPTRDFLLQAAADEDRGRAAEPEPKEPEVTDPEPTTDKPVAKPAAKQEEKKEATDKSADSNASKPEEKPKSKWAQNEERKAKTWQEINAEKEAVKAEKEAVARERAEITRRNEEAQRAKANSEPYRDEHGYTAKDYLDTAKQFRAKGDNQSAEACEQLASNINKKHQELVVQRDRDDLVREWSRSIEALSEKHPDLKNVDSDLHKTVKAVLDEMPVLRSTKDGLNQAVRAANIIIQARTFDGTKAELEKLKTEHEKLSKKLSIAGGSPTSAPTDEEKPFEKLSSAEQRKRLEQAARNHDREAGFD